MYRSCTWSFEEFKGENPPPPFLQAFFAIVCFLRNFRLTWKIFTFIQLCFSCLWSLSFRYMYNWITLFFHFITKCDLGIYIHKDENDKPLCLSLEQYFRKTWNVLVVMLWYQDVVNLAITFGWNRYCGWSLSEKTKM